jgi:hypothetical protein
MSMSFYPRLATRTALLLAAVASCTDATAPAAEEVFTQVGAFGGPLPALYYDHDQPGWIVGGELRFSATSAEWTVRRRLGTGPVTVDRHTYLSAVSGPYRILARVDTLVIAGDTLRRLHEEQGFVFTRSR